MRPRTRDRVARRCPWTPGLSADMAPAASRGSPWTRPTTHPAGRRRPYPPHHPLTTTAAPHPVPAAGPRTPAGRAHSRGQAPRKRRNSARAGTPRAKNDLAVGAFSNRGGPDRLDHRSPNESQPTGSRSHSYVLRSQAADPSRALQGHLSLTIECVL